LSKILDLPKISEMPKNGAWSAVKNEFSEIIRRALGDLKKSLFRQSLEF